MRSVSAMIAAIAFAALALLGLLSTLAALPRDGYRRIPTDPSRLP